MSWDLKSTSDTDEVYAEYDDDGNETGRYTYRLFARPNRALPDVPVTGVVERAQLPRWIVPTVAASGAVLGVIVSRLVGG